VRAAAARSRTAAGERPPRLLLRFAVLSALGIGLAAAAILVVVRHAGTSTAERGAIRQARLLADAVLPEQLRAEDALAPVPGERRAELDRFFERSVLRDGTVRVSIVAADGRITYSTDHRLIGATRQIPRVAEARTGQIVAQVRGGGPQTAPRVLDALVPLVLSPGGVRAVADVEQDYRPIEAAARRAFLPVAAVLEALLVVLFLVLAPALVAVTRRIRRQVAEIERSATHDALTELPNRVAFGERVAELLAQDRAAPFAVLHVDVERFGEVNETLGHDRGDELLTQLASRLRSALRDGSVLARLDADEFGVLVPGVGVEQARAVATRVRAAADAPFQLSGVPVGVELSAGIAAAPAHGSTAEALLQHADVALSLAKRQRSGYAVYDPAFDTRDTERLTLLGELRDALEREELVLFFQPRARLDSGEIRAVEALVRWQHHERGLLGPGAFVPAAEHTGLIRPLGRYVLERALRQQVAWRREGIDLEVGVNLTMVDLLDAALPDEVAALLRREGVQASRLVAEITESSLMSDPVRVHDVVTRLSALGVRIAVDDFGTGYSSLAYLSRLPVDEIKIDRSFVQAMTERPEDASIVASIVDLARNLGLACVAEGVETQAHWDALRRLGCDHAQGYLLGKPMPADALADLVRARAAA